MNFAAKNDVTALLPPAPWIIIPPSLSGTLAPLFRHGGEGAAFTNLDQECGAGMGVGDEGAVAWADEILYIIGAYYSIPNTITH